MRRVLLAGIVVLLLTTSANAFDGVRRGFVLGGGLGLTANASWEADFEFLPNAGENQPGLGAEFLIGYAWDNHNMIVYNANVTGYRTNVGVLDDVAVGQGFGGPAWYHYFGHVGSSAFTVVGAGIYVFTWDFEETGISGENDSGYGLLVGGGYEFSDHVQIGVYFGAGKTEEPSTGIEFKHGHVNVLLTAVAF